jgi:hypothetical protein
MLVAEIGIVMENLPDATKNHALEGIFMWKEKVQELRM